MGWAQVLQPPGQGPAQRAGWALACVQPEPGQGQALGQEPVPGPGQNVAQGPGHFLLGQAQEHFLPGQEQVHS